MRPGITGITQLAFADESHILDKHDPIGDYVNRILPSKLQLDAFYAQRNHLRLDAAVLFWTIAAVIMHRPVAVNRATGRMNTRRRPAADAALRGSSHRLRPRVALPDTRLRVDGRPQLRWLHALGAPHRSTETATVATADELSCRAVSSSESAA